MIGAVLRLRYEIVKLLQDGPVYTLYGAKDKVTGEEVSIRTLKEPCSQEPAFVDKVAAVVAKQSSVKHEGIERLREVDRHDDVPFIVGDAAQGAPLSERLRKLGSFSVPVAASMGVVMGEALQALHKAGIVHGDVGAHTGTLLPDGSVRLRQAGLWEACQASENAGPLSLPTMAPYLAPEVAEGAMPTPASDIYALGVTLFELVTGRFPYIAGSPAAYAEKHAQAPVPSMRLLNPSVPLVLDEIVRKCMHKDPKQRYANAEALVKDLKTLQDALRFGRSLTWPLGSQEPAKEMQPVAPKLSAVPIEPKERFDPDSGEVPMWIKVSIGFFSGLLVLMLGGWIVFNLNKPREIVLPNLIGQSVPEANQMLSNLGLKLRISAKQASEKVAADRVLDQNPPAKGKVREGAFVNVIVSLGSKFVEVPDLRGMTVDQAKSMLGTVDLELSDSVQEVADRSVEAGMIVGQLPGQHSKVERFTSIRVRISSGKNGDSSGGGGPKFEYTLRIKITDVPVPVTVRVDMTDDEGTRSVYEEYHEPDETFTVTAEGVGKEVLFRIFYDGELVKQVPMKPEEQSP